MSLAYSTVRHLRCASLQFLVLCQLVLGSHTAARAAAADDLLRAAQACSTRDDLIGVVNLQATLPLDTATEAMLAEVLSRSGMRCFRRDGQQCDRILQAVVRQDGHLSFTYRRNNQRVGLANGYADRIGDYVVFSGTWYQQSKLDKRILIQPAATVDITWLTQSLLQYWDQGGFVYIFRLSPGTITQLGGAGIDYRDQPSPNPNWISFQ